MLFFAKKRLVGVLWKLQLEKNRENVVHFDRTSISCDVHAVAVRLGLLDEN